MEIILTEITSSLTGRLSSNHSYTISSKPSVSGGYRFFSRRVSPYVYDDLDDSHVRFILDLARMAVGGDLSVKDIRITVRELAEAIAEMHGGRAFWLRDKSVGPHTLATFIGLTYRHVKPSTVLNASDVIKLENIIF
ncbi:MAG: hypothetical protein IJT12_09675 [Paludibacteraceae bacterium]|nr:hypothetical protein [Paludibacteraceae bacterium]